jgi:hypothetical protein
VTDGSWIKGKGLELASEPVPSAVVRDPQRGIKHTWCKNH